MGPVDALGLPFDRVQDSVVSGGFGDGGEDPVQRVGDDGCRRSPAQAPGGRFVDEVGGGDFLNVGLSPDALAEMGVPACFCGCCDYPAAGAGGCVSASDCVQGRAE